MGIFRRTRTHDRTNLPGRRHTTPSSNGHHQPAADQGRTGTSESPVITIDARTFMEETAKGYTVVDFWAPWCGPCIQFAPLFDEVARDYEGRVRFGKLNVDQNPEVSALLQIRSIPTLVVFDPEGNEAARITGVPRRRDLDQLLDQLTSTER